MTDNGETLPLIGRRVKKWPFMFWFLLRVLALFYHRSVVSERKCFNCHIRDISSPRKGTLINGMDTPLDYYVLAYESSTSDAAYANETKNLNVQSWEDCGVCQTLWWNCHRVPEKYTEQEIGLSKWGCRLNGVFSIGWLVIALAILCYYIGSFVPQLYGNPDDILKLLIKLTFFVLLATHYVIALCSKLRSVFKCAAPRLSWATSFNVRYLIKRAQYLDMSNRGLPGVPFLLLCAGCPLFLAVYRTVIWTYISNCPITIYSITQATTGVIFMVTGGFSIYILYFLRISFQCQFNLLTAYVKEFEDDVRRCKAVVLEVAADFACYQQLCSLYLAVNFPTVVLAVVANITLAYTIHESKCLDEVGQRIAYNVAILSWSEIAIAMILSAMAMGGYKVRYIWENFVANVLIMESNKSKAFRLELVTEAEILLKESNLLLATIIFSVTGIYMGFQFGNQNITMLNDSCNGTFVPNACI